VKCMLLFGLLLFSVAARSREDVVFQAMHDEMQRSLQKLRLENLDKPYFISYRVIDNDSKEVAATLGSVLLSTENHTRSLTVVVRVGDYASDNSNFLSLNLGGGSDIVQMFAGTVQLPLEDNYIEIRRQIWLATDGAYKKALEDMAGKRAALLNRTATDELADFSKVSPATMTDMSARVDLDLPSATRLVRDASAVFRGAPSIQTSQARIVADNRFERYLNSEGSTFTRLSPRVSLRISASAQAADGTPLSDFIMVFGNAEKDLPSEAVLLPQIHALQEGLIKLQTAPIEDRYNGPILFEGQAGAEVFARHFAVLLPAQPPLISNNAQIMDALRPQQPSSLLDKMGARVLPDFLDVVDDPTATRDKDGMLFGAYKVDQEGVPAKRTLIVHQGILQTVLSSRAPLRGVPDSTGNLREHGVAPSNLFVIAAKSLTLDELRRQLIAAAQKRGNHYGIAVRRLSGNSATLAYRLYEDGHEELIRSANISGLSAASFKDIIAVSDQPVVFTEATPMRAASPFNVNPFGGAAPLESYIVPALLFDDLSIVRASGGNSKPPIVGNPLAEK
jgi:predicted Zn-dependent protease